MHYKNGQKNEAQIPLRRVLGLFAATLMVIGNMVSTGVYKKIVPMAATGLPGSFILGAWIVAGLIALFGAFTISGLARMTTSSGGIYEYLRLSFGELPAFLFGWSYFIIMGSGAQAAVSIIFAQSVNSVVPLGNPLQSWDHLSIGNFVYPFRSSGIKILSIAVMVALTWVNYRGVKKGAGLNNVVTIAKITGILGVIILGLSYGGSNAGATEGEVADTLANASSVSAFFLCILSAYWAYSAFETVAFVTGEIINPQRNVPMAIISGVGLTIILYVLVNAAYLNILPASELAGLTDNQIAAVAVIQQILGNEGTLAISLLIIISSLGSMNVRFITQPRLMYRMAQENAFFKSAARVHPRWRTPYVSIVLMLAWCIVLALSGTFDVLTDMVIFISFFFFGLLSAGLFKMKREGKITDRVPGYPWAPALYILFSLAIMINTLIEKPVLSFVGLLLAGAGIPFYYLFKKQAGISKEVP